MILATSVTIGVIVVIAAAATAVIVLLSASRPSGPKTFRLGQWYPGPGTFEGFIISRAKASYPCGCGQHSIEPGELYRTITPTRWGSRTRGKYRHRYSLSHLQEHVQVVDGRGRILAEMNRPKEGDNVEQSIRAQRFELVDESGTLRGAFGIANGEPALALFDPTGQVRAQVSLANTGSPIIAVYHANGQAAISIGVGPDGAVGINVSNAAGKPQVGIGATKSGASVILSSDEGAQVTINSLSSGPGINLLYKDKIRLTALLQLDGSPAIALADAQGKPRLQGALDVDGSPMLDLNDAAGRCRIQANVGDDATMLATYTSDGQETWKAGV